MKVSVVVVVHNRLKDCNELLESLVHQTIAPFEIIVIDDNSIPSYVPPIHLRKKVSLYTRLKIIRTRCELGLGRCRSLGATIAEGDVIAFIDDDAIPSPTWIEYLIRTFRRSNADIVGGICKPFFLTKKIPKWFDVEFFGKYLAVENNFIVGCNFAVKSSVFREIGFFNPLLGRFRGLLISNEERDFIIRAYNAGKKIVLDPNVVVFHKITEKRLKISYIIKRIFYQGVSIFFTAKNRSFPVFRAMKETLNKRAIEKTKRKISLSDLPKYLLWMIFSGLGFLLGIFFYLELKFISLRHENRLKHLLAVVRRTDVNR